jgi:glutamate dehydrogenase (NAD(P)+)
MDKSLRIVPPGAGIENEDVTPDAVHTFYDEERRVLGHLVVDSSIQGLSVGGVRMVPGLPLMDLCHLARAMTLKYSFLKLPFGGAKAAILTHCDAPSPEQRRHRIELFAAQLIPLGGTYLPGEDAGTNRDDLDLIRRIARPERIRHVPDSGFHTAMTVRICVEHLAREKGLNLARSTVAIEGLGKVGGWVARHLSDLGCRIVAVSTRRGGLYQPDGLDVDGLLRARDAVGDDCVTQVEGARRIDKEQLPTLPVDLLIPCALSWSVRGANAAEVQARCVVCGANNAVTDRAKEVLAARGITCFPDFVSNSGGVLGSVIEMVCMDRRRAAGLLRRQFEPKVQGLLAQARDTGRSLETVAREVAMENYTQMKHRRTTAMTRLSAALARAYRHGLLPGSLVRAFAGPYIRRMMA